MMFKKIPLSLVFIYAVVSTSFSATILWDGGAGTSNWTDANNWSTNAVPTAGDDVQVTGAYTISLASTTAIQSLFINNASAVVTISTLGSLTIDGAATGVTIRNGTLTNDGILNISNMSNDGMYLGISSSTLVVFNNNSGATLDFTNIADMAVLTEYPATTVNNSGIITLNAPGDDGFRVNRFSTINNNLGGIINVLNGSDVGFALDRTGYVNNAGTINITNCTRHGFELYVRATDTQYARLNNLPTGIMNLNSTNLSGGSDGNGMRLSNNAIVNNDGQINGDGNAGPEISMQSNALTFINTATSAYAPGASPGTFSVSGADFNLGTSTYNCEINGTTASTQHDVMDFSGDVDITNSDLIVDFGVFTPSDAESYIILTAGSVTGTFNSVTIPAVAGIAFTVNYQPTFVEIQTTSTLPVELVNFNAIQENTNAVLTWQTVSELNNAGFDIQRSTNGIDWINLDFINGQGNSLQTIDYSFIDDRPLIAMNYYRLKQIDYDGEYSYSHIKSVDINNAANSLIYPNPTKGNLNTTEIESGTFVITDGNGRIRKTGTFNNSNFSIHELPAGIYFMKLTSQNRSVIKKVVKE